MKLHFTAIALLFILLSNAGLARTSDLYASKYYVFQSNLQLNAHLFLYNKAIACKFGKAHEDSLVHFAFKDKANTLSQADLTALSGIIRFYRDSLLSRDLLFDSLMRNVSDHLSSGSSSKIKLKTPWQLATLEHLRLFQPYFTKLYWHAIDSTNRAWLNLNKNQITAMEGDIVKELEKIYKTTLPEGRIRVDLSCYATWAGAYSYNDAFCHVIFSTASKANQGDLAVEVLFHETSHFLADRLMTQITTQLKHKRLEKPSSLWHDVIFYTTGFVLEKHYKLKWQKFEPYYVQMKFQDKFPAFKNSVDGCKLHWDPYLQGQATFDESISKLVNFVAEK
ncbi:MAG: hypothetical protein V4635_06515 [Bacteroidota bacterium]